MTGLFCLLDRGLQETTDSVVFQTPKQAQAEGANAPPPPLQSPEQGASEPFHRNQDGGLRNLFWSLKHFSTSYQEMLGR